MGNKKHPSVVQNWALTSNNRYAVASAEKALQKAKKQNSGKKLKLVKNPNGPGMIEIEDK